MRGIALILLLAAAPGWGVEPRKVQNYRRSMLGPRPLARTAAGAAFQHVRNSPHEWGRGFGGFARRFASGFGQHAVKQTVQFGVGVLRHEDQRYVPSRRKGVWPRLKYASLNTVLVRRDNGGRTIAAGRISGAMAGGMVSRLWQPPRLQTFASGFSSGGISLGIDWAGNVAREFWPRKAR